MAVKLEPYKGKKYRCPNCDQPKKFVRYVIVETGEYIADNVGRCDRIDNCGYHFTPRQYYAKNPINIGAGYQVKSMKKEPEKPVQFLPRELVFQSMSNYDNNNFFQFLSTRFGESEAKVLSEKYCLGTSRHWEGANVFWQLDISFNVRQCKIMLYDSQTGKRVKSGAMVREWNSQESCYKSVNDGMDKVLVYGRMILNRKFQNLNLQQCFFGEHLLNSEGTVAIVESEKTAMISSLYFPNFIWMATGGSNGAGMTKPHVCKVLKGREVILFPDLGQFEKWSHNAKEIQGLVRCKVKVSDLLEKQATLEERSKGLDIADYLLNNDQSHEVKPVQTKQQQEFLEVINTEFGWRPLEGFEGF